MAVDWLTPLLAFAGGLVGAGIPAWVALRGQRQAARSEWRERLPGVVGQGAETVGLGDALGVEVDHPVDPVEEGLEVCHLIATYEMREKPRS